MGKPVNTTSRSGNGASREPSKPDPAKVGPAAMASAKSTPSKGKLQSMEEFSAEMKAAKLADPAVNPLTGKPLPGVKASAPKPKAPDPAPDPEDDEEVDIVGDEDSAGDDDETEGEGETGATGEEGDESAGGDADSSGASDGGQDLPFPSADTGTLRDKGLAYIDALDGLDAAEADYWNALSAAGIKGNRRHKLVIPADDPGTEPLVLRFKAGRAGKVVEAPEIIVTDVE